MPKQQAQLDVTFELDANGILKVTAKERISSKSANLVISNSLRLSSTQIQQMIDDAEKWAAQPELKGPLAGIPGNNFAE